jgi:hypothetical protein
MIYAELSDLICWFSSGGARRALWCKRRYFLVAGACSGELDCGGARRSMVTASYGDSYNSVRCSGDSDSHLGASKVIAGVNRRWRWPQPRRFRRVCYKGKRRKSADWDLPSSIQPPGDPRRQSGAPGLDGEASGDLKRRRRTSAGARVSVGDEKNLGEEELGFLGLIHSGGTPFIGDGGRRSSSWVSGRRRRIGRSPVLHRAAWSEMEDDGFYFESVPGRLLVG